jgi:hypothetical protein
MNIIKTVGDFKKALSAYPDDLSLEFVTSDYKVLYLKTDFQITMVDSSEGVFLEISLLSEV